MIYKLKFKKTAEKQFLKLDKFTQKRIQVYLNKNVANSENPRAVGKGLTENKSGYWRYCIGDYRIICNINDDVCEILTVQIGHRKEVYN